MDEHPFKKMARSYHERAAAMARVHYEESKVRYLLKKLKAPAAVERALRRRYELETGQSLLTFGAFNDEYPSFPVLLGAVNLRSIHTDSRTFLPSLMRRFEDAPFVAPYEDFYERHEARATEEGRLVGLVFPRKGIPSGLIIYKSDDFEAIPFAGKELFLPYLSGKGSDRRFLIVRSFAKVLEAVHNNGHGWKVG